MEPTRREAMGISLGLLATPWMGRWQDVGEVRESQVPEPAPRIARFEGLAFGMFVHWGLYSQIGKGEWAKKLHGIPTDEYMRLMQTFTASEFSGRDVARIARSAGMRYVTHTSRHHDGFSLYDTQGLSPYDITHTPAGRDLIADFVGGCRAEGIVPMLYCTTLDWTDPRFENDWKAYQQYLRASVELLCTNYGEIGGFWFDGNWSRPEADWELDALYGVIREHQPEALIINNTGIEHGGALGHPEIDSVTFERGRPRPLDRRGHPKYVAGEMCHTFNFHWGIATRDFNYLSPAQVIESLCSCRGAGANLLMNVGPNAEGGVPAYERAALARVGDWLALHGGLEGPIYSGRPAGIVGEERDFGLVQGEQAFLYVFDLTATADSRVGVEARGPGPRTFTGVPERFTGARWVDSGEQLQVERDGDRLVLHATKYPYGTNTVVRVAQLEA
jgi:alpha-L-fucosidase